MIFQLGRSPQHSHFIDQGNVRRTPSIEGKFLTLHLDDEKAYLQAGEQKSELPHWQGCELQLLWTRPAKGGGRSDLALFDPVNNRFTFYLLESTYEALDWMRGTGELVAHSLGIERREVDLGADC